MTNSQEPRPRLSPAEFRRLRQQGDPPVDEAVAAYRRAHPELDDARELVRSVIQELARAKRTARANPPTSPDSSHEPDEPQEPVGLLAELGAVSTLPDWGTDAALIERGQRVFKDHGLYQAVALFCAALPMAYAEPSSAKVLAGISDLATGNLTRRVAETGQLLIDLMGMRGPGSLRPGGPGHTTAVGLRILHAFVRALVWERRESLRWDADKDGEPVNQELLLATLFDFSAVVWEAMERMGIELSDADRTANLYVWSVFGNLMGVESCATAPLRTSDIAPAMEHFGEMLAATPEGRRLMAALLDEMESFMFLGWRKLPRSLIRWLFQDWEHGMGRMPDLLGVPRPAWWSWPLFATARAAHRPSPLPDLLRPVVRVLLRKAGRCMVIGFADLNSGGHAPFQVPDEVARAWRIGRGPSTPRLRAARRRVRHAVRRPLGRGSFGPGRLGRRPTARNQETRGLGTGGREAPRQRDGPGRKGAEQEGHPQE